MGFSMFYEMTKVIRLVVASILVCVVGYTALTLAGAAMLAPDSRLGSLVHDANGNVVGSRLVAQSFSRPEYLWPRPSAVDYDAAGAGGSNLSPNNPEIAKRAEKILTEFALPESTSLPAELVLASGSGLDPHITLEAALVQVDRIATSRSMDASQIKKLLGLDPDNSTVSSSASSSASSVAPQGLVNVLEFNLLLDSRFSVTDSQ